ncbi:hypothetical protein QT381_07000 [Galbitalea sp. SE-J8]|uniref:hypothetical protein n=1 Tax=Galbitalea sp. SE-J8 TaxID=3054952 RepID=UPI00259C734A|nr:hypothetical protein [Galbitalea sp. SE-J8]MDM4762752.1 hypothetical protein [Galbitalea sp. SE-J8]
MPRVRAAASVGIGLGVTAAGPALYGGIAVGLGALTLAIALAASTPRPARGGLATVR